MKVSWCLLTYNREDIVKESIKHNKKTAGYPIDEIVWCDNASTDNVRAVVQRILSPGVAIFNTKNVGAEQGYNRCMQLARGDYLAITGCDTLMPKNWLKTFVEYQERIPNLGCSCIYSQGSYPERYYDTPIEINGLSFQKAMPTGRRFFKRSLLQSFGYHREDLSLYGWSDCIWAHTVEYQCDKLGLLYGVIPNLFAQPIADTDMCYVQWKHDQASNDETIKKRNDILALGCPPYFP